MAGQDKLNILKRANRLVKEDRSAPPQVTVENPPVEYINPLKGIPDEDDLVYLEQASCSFSEMADTLEYSRSETVNVGGNKILKLSKPRRPVEAGLAGGENSSPVDSPMVTRIIKRGKSFSNPEKIFPVSELPTMHQSTVDNSTDIDDEESLFEIPEDFSSEDFATDEFPMDSSEAFLDDFEFEDLLEEPEEYLAEDLDGILKVSGDFESVYSVDDDLFDLIGVDITELARHDQDLIGETTLTEGGLSGYQRARQLAAEYLLNAGWERDSLKLIVGILENSGNAHATTKALLLEAELGLTPEELVLAWHVRDCWSGNRHYWMAFNWAHSQAEERYCNCSWTIAIKLVRCFHGLPDPEELTCLLEREYQRWYSNDSIRQRTRSYMKYLLARINDFRSMDFDPSHSEMAEWSNVSDCHTSYLDRMGWASLGPRGKLSELSIVLPKERREKMFGMIVKEVFEDNQAK